jgi:hypothetical protein
VKKKPEPIVSIVASFAMILLMALISTDLVPRSFDGQRRNERTPAKSYRLLSCLQSRSTFLETTTSEPRPLIACERGRGD